MNGFDRAKTITITGTVKQFKWANPHSWIEVEVVNSKGAAETWNLEMTAPGILARAGWKSTMLKAGDKSDFSGSTPWSMATSAASSSRSLSRTALP